MTPVKQSSFRYGLLDKIMKQLEETHISFDFEQGDIVQALFEGNNIELVKFKDRMHRDKNYSANAMFREMYKKIRK